MKKTKILAMIGVAFLALVATTISPSLLSAEDFTGTVTLPVETHWGIMTLPAGEYRFKVNISVSPYIVRVYGKKGIIVTMSAGSSDEKGGGPRELVLIRQGNKGFVISLRLPQEGVAFRYSLPGGQKAPLLAEGPYLFQRIAITADSDLDVKKSEHSPKS